MTLSVRVLVIKISVFVFIFIVKEACMVYTGRGFFLPLAHPMLASVFCHASRVASIHV